MYRSFLAGLTMYVEFYFIYSAIYILLFFPTAFLNISLRLSYLCRQCVLQPFSMFPLQMTLVSLSDEGEETISSLSHSTKAVTTACGPMEALHAGRYKDLPSITYEMEQWSRVCRGMLSDLKEAKSEGTDLAQVFARNKEVTDVTTDWDADEGFRIASVDEAGNIVIHDVPTYEELKTETPPPK
eukprot:m.86285 g.86285  ORF g.86285 m.86285 type:complete len:184 (-) comp8755_c0_seq17:199-750(-)